MLKGISRYFSFKDRGPTRFLLPLLWWLDFIVSWSLKLYPSNSSWGLSSSIFFFRFPSLLPSVIYSPQIAPLFLRGISQVLESPRILRLCFMFFPSMWILLYCRLSLQNRCDSVLNKHRSNRFLGEVTIYQCQGQSLPLFTLPRS